MLKPETGVACLAGRHGPLVDGVPQDLGGCVNVDRICSLCAEVVSTVSWTKAAWRKQRRRCRVR